MAKKKVRPVTVRRKERKKKAKHRARAIVVGHLEKIGRKVFEDYPEQITGLTEGTQGVYALYLRQKLYYIGLASDLKRRIRWHLKDHHREKWDRFSLYIIRKTDHIREVESLLVRIAEPKGNRIRGELGRSKSLVRELQRAVKQQQEIERGIIFGDGRGKAGRRKGKRRKKGKEGGTALKGLLRNGQAIYANYKGKSYRAVFYTQRGIKLRGKFYSSLSGAGKAILDRGAVNGWRFWKYKDKEGNLVMLKDLRG